MRLTCYIIMMYAYFIGTQLTPMCSGRCTLQFYKDLLVIIHTLPIRTNLNDTVLTVLYLHFKKWCCALREEVLSFLYHTSMPVNSAQNVQN